MPNNKKLKPLRDGDDISHVQYVVCVYREQTVLDEYLSVQICDAQCGSFIMFPKSLNIPQEIPKVCPRCSDWLGNCIGEA